MARSRSRCKDYLVYLLVRSLVCIIGILSWRTCRSLAGMLAALAYRLNRRHREVAFDNLRHAFPGLSDKELDRLVRDVYRHFALMAFEMVHVPRKIHFTNFWEHTRYPNPSDYERAVNTAATGRPLILLTGHFGNWEVFSHVLGVAGYRGSVVARKLDNPYLDRYLHKLRAQCGQRFLDKSGSVDEIEATMQRSEMLGMLFDQDAGQKGLFVDFLGRPASTFKSIALLSLQYQAPIIVYGAARTSGDFQYLFYVPAIIYPEDYARECDPMRAITQRFTAALEEVIRRHPEQYFWLHRRWKHQPKARKTSVKAA